VPILVGRVGAILTFVVAAATARRRTAVDPLAAEAAKTAATAEKAGATAQEAAATGSTATDPPRG
jgi:hypothetical protein